MNIVKTYKFKLYRSKKKSYLHQQIDIAGLIYNHCIALHRRYYRLTGKHLSQYDLMRHLTKLKKLPRYAHWNRAQGAPGSQAIQDIVQRIDKAYKLFFEDLAMKGMQALWGRKVGDLARSEFMGILQYVATTKGRIVHLVDRFYPSSKTCSDCGHIQELTLSDRRWVCAGCGVIHDRDHNAAVNLLREGASSLRLGDVRPSSTAIAARP